MANETVLPFGPFVRCVTSVEPHRVPADAMAGGQNMLVDPIAGGAFKRGGVMIAGGDVVSGATNHATNGILESSDKWSAKPIRLRQFYSDALADGAQGGYPTYSCLFMRTDLGSSWPLADIGEIVGTEYVRRPNANYQLMQEFGSSAYPTAGGAMGAEIKYKVVPWWYESGEGGYNRGAFAFARRFAVSGSWGSVDAGRWRYYGGLRGTPIRWDGGCNDSSASISNAIRVTPTGPFAPLWVPTIAENGTSNPTTFSTPNATYPWLGGDTFYLSVMFQFEDGSYSQPTYPILKTVGVVGTAYGFTSLTYGNIPIGPEGTIARVLLRSPKVFRTATTGDITVSIDDMRILGVLRNNTQKSYVDLRGDDDALLQDTDVVRWDLICPPRSRYLGTGDQRVIAGYTLPNPSAIQLSCVGISTDYDMNFADTSTVISGTTSALYRVTTTALELIVASAGSALATTTIDWATYTTVQAVVDAINATARDATHGQWRAQIAPGADPSAASTGLCPTVLTATNCTATGTSLATTTSQAFEAVPVGYKCYAVAGMTAGTYVRSKDCTTAAANTATLSQASTTGSGGAATVTFYADCGDEACVTTAGSKGWIRTFGSAYPGMIYFKRSALEGYARPKKDRIYFTISSPGAAATGVSVAANAWGASNRRDGVGDSGQVMGIVDVEGAAVIAYRDRIGLFINERGSNTAEDFDYRIKTINDTYGAVSPWSVFGVAGCAVYGTSVGIKATDKSRREILLTGDNYQPVRGLGDFAYEIPQCVDAAAKDSFDCWLGGSSFGNRIIYSFRRSATTYGWVVYDFSPGMDQLGLEALADPQTRKTYGWSTLCFMDQDNDIFGPRAHGAVQGSGGLLFYGAINDNSGTTDGRIDKFFTGETDNGVEIVGSFATRRVLAEPGMRFVAQSVTSAHRSDYSGPTIDIIRTESGVANTRSITSSGSNDITYERLQWGQEARSPARMIQLQWYDDSADSGALSFNLSQNVEVIAKVGD